MPAGKGILASSYLNPLRALRWRFRRTTAALRYQPHNLARSPIIFGNSVPKSGTHLLAQVLSAFPRIGLAIDRGMGPILTYERQTGRLRSTTDLFHEVQRLGPGDLCFGHVIASPEVIQLWHQKNVVHFFMLRDPRDVVISHAFYIGDKATQNVHHEFYKSLPTMSDRIRVSILGRPDWQAEGGIDDQDDAPAGDFPDIGKRYDRYLGWLDSPQVCLLRFEDFIQDRQTNLEHMLDFACERNFQLHVSQDQALNALSEAIQPQRSFTFRKGETGEWVSHFTDEHKQLFKQVAGQLLVRLGYEVDDNW